MDPTLVAEKLAYIAKRLLSMVHLRDGRGRWQLLTLDAADRTDKHIIMRVLAQVVESIGADVLIEVGPSRTISTSADLSR